MLRWHIPCAVRPKRIKSDRTVEAVSGSSQVANVWVFPETVALAVCQVKEQAMEHALDSVSKVSLA